MTSQLAPVRAPPCHDPQVGGPRTRSAWGVLVVPVAIAAVLVAPAPTAADTVEVDELPPDVDPGGFCRWLPVDVNRAGQILADCNTFATEGSIVWSEDGSVVDLRLLGRPPGAAPRSPMQSFDLSDGGVVVGSTGDAFRADLGAGSFTRLVDIPGSGSAAVAVDEAGTAVGNVLSGRAARAVAWRPDGTEVDLAPLTETHDINTGGRIVGSRFGELDGVYGDHPLVFDLVTAEVRDLTVAVRPVVGDSLGAMQINDRDQALVVSGDAIHSGGYRAMVVDVDTGAELWRAPANGVSRWVLTDAGEIGVVEVDELGASESVAVTDLETGQVRRHSLDTGSSPFLDLNDRGQAAFSDVVDGSLHALLWDPVLGVFDLGDGNGEGVSAVAVNDSGTVAGQTVEGQDLWRARVGLAPAAPVGLVATSSDGGVELTWSTPPSEGTGDVTAYRVVRDGEATIDVVGGARRAVDPAPGPGTHTYVVVATNRHGDSPPSEAVDVRVDVPLAAPPAPSPVVPRFTG